MSFLPLVFAAVGLVGLVGLALYKAVQLFVPETAHRKIVEAQTHGYDSQYKGNHGRPGKKERETTHRSRSGPKGSRGDAAAAYWQRSSQSGQGVVRSLVQANSEFVEIRSGPLGCKYGDVEGFDPIANSWALYLGGNWMMLPSHLLFAFADIEREEIFVTCRRGVKHTFNVKECVECIQLPGDVCLITVPGVRPRRSVVGHFAEELPKHGKIEHLIPAMHYTSIEAVTAMSWENASHTIPVNTEYDDFETDLRLHGIPNERGMCGTVYVHQATGKIVAVHMGGSPSSMTASRS